MTPENQTTGTPADDIESGVRAASRAAFAAKQAASAFLATCESETLREVVRLAQPPAAVVPEWIAWEAEDILRNDRREATNG